MAWEKGRHDARDQPFLNGTSLGDQEVVRLLYERYGARIRSYCMRRLDKPADVEDAVQETFLKAQRGLQRFDRSAPAWPWLVTIAAHVCTDIHRAHSREADGDLEGAPTAAAEPDEQAALRTRVTIVDDALRSLPTKYRVSLFMRHFEGLSHEEIARVQGVSIASVKSVLLRGRRELGARIEALARMERQWPLPSTVSVIAQRLRDRVRVWQRAVERVVQGAVTVIDSAVSLGALLAQTPAAIVAVGALTTTVAGVVAGVSTGSRSHGVVAQRPPIEADSPVRAPALAVGDRHRAIAVGGRPQRHDTAPPFFSVEPPTPPIGPSPPLPGGSVDVADHHDGGMDVFVDPLGLSVWTDCTQTTFERLGCQAARLVLPIVEEHDPGAPDTGVGAHPH